MVMASKFNFTTEINMSEVEKEKEGLVQVTTISRAQPTVRRGRNTKKPEADNVHLLPRVSGGTRCALCVAALWFHWTLKHLENKNKDIFWSDTDVSQDIFILLFSKEKFLPHFKYICIKYP